METNKMKQTYEAPELKVVAFQVERGFAGSTDQYNRNTENGLFDSPSPVESDGSLSASGIDNNFRSKEGWFSN